MKFHILVILSFILLLVSACNGQLSSPTAAAFQTQVPATPSPLLTNSPRPTTTPQPTPPATNTPVLPYETPTEYYSAPKDGNLDTICRITIDLFFSYKQGFRIEQYRELFIPSSQYLADNVTPPAEARTLLKLMPASQWWKENFPDKTIPGNLLPEEPNEYVYYTEFTYHYDPSTTPVASFPDAWTFHMIADGANSCKIKSYGKG